MIAILLLLQAGAGAVSGTVTDERTGEPLAGAIVTLPALHRSIASDPSGRYTFVAVPQGAYQITVRFIGYAPRTLVALVAPDATLEIGVALRAEPVTLDPLDVTEQSRSSFPDRGTTMQTLAAHPLLAEPDVFQALAGGDVVMTPETPNGLHVKGGATDQTAYLLDGVPVFSPYHSAGLFSAWNPDALLHVRLSSAAPLAEHPNTLAGTVAAVSRTPGSRLEVAGGMSTTQLRATGDGPIGRAGAGFLLSVRSGLPGGIAGDRDYTYLKGESGDRLYKLEAPLLGGRMRLLGYDGENELNAASAGLRRHAFAWRSESYGGEWRRDAGATSLRLLGWSAAGTAAADWVTFASDVAIGMASKRHDRGFLASLEHATTRTSSVLGLRVEHSVTSYRVASDTAGLLALAARTLVGTAFAEHARTLNEHVEVSVGASASAASDGPRIDPAARITWQPSSRWSFFAGYARQHQFAQSLRNAESVVGNVFPADLYVGSGAPGVPVASSDQGVIAAEYRPTPRVRARMQAYARRSADVVLVAPLASEPFATQSFAVGSSSAWGATFDLTATIARASFLARYGAQRVRWRDGTRSYAPADASTHLFEGGVTLLPSNTLSIRAGLAGALGRRATTFSGGVEWEACNLVDRGCEFAGSPRYDGAALGGASLPAYLRADLSVRKAWRVTVGGRVAEGAAFATVTNVFNRRNVLAYARDEATGQATALDMRPLAPLVVGLDWRF